MLVMTQFVLVFLSLSRLMVVVHPIDTKFKRLEFTLKLQITAHGLSFAIAVLITFIFRYSFGNSTISFCSPFIDQTGSFVVIKVVIWFVAISQTATSLVIIVMHILLVKKLKESQENITKLKNADSNTTLIIQLVIISTSNIICWFPANGVYIAAMFLSAYPTDLGQLLQDYQLMP